MQRRLKKYKLTEVEYNALMQTQRGLCAICRVRPPTAVDHDHETGRVRGLLCHHCNAGIGMFKESLGIVRAAVAYLEKVR